MTACPLEVRPENVWQYAQNRPSLLCADFARLFGVPPADTMRILLARGVSKWLAGRRDLIREKNVWRAQITATLAEIREAKRAKDVEHLHYLRGRLVALNECRQAVRRICHSERWRVPDHDGRAAELAHELASNASAAQRPPDSSVAETPEEEH